MKQPPKWDPDYDGGPLDLPGFEKARRHGWMLFVEGSFKDRPVHVRVVACQQFWMVMTWIYHRRIYRAVQSEAYREWLRAELLGINREPQSPLFAVYPEQDYEIVEHPPMRRMS